MQIHYLRHQEIDKEKWNLTIDRAVNGQIYAYTWYLDCLAENWDALVTDDYVFVMPLPWNAKWFGVKQIYQPIFAQQLGLFGIEVPNDILLQCFLECIPSRFKYIHTHLNEQNTPLKIKDFAIKPRVNMLLDLEESHEVIFKKYKKSLRAHIRKAEPNLEFHINKISAEFLVDCYYKNLNQKVGLREDYYQAFQKLIETAISKEKANIYSAHFHSGEFASGLFIGESHNRLVQLMGPSTSAGKKAQAKSFLINEIIKHHSSSEKVMDFEGSEIPSIAKFFKSFGVREVAYSQIIRDNNPRWLKLFQHFKKKIKK